MYHSMNNVDFNTIKILKYAGIKLFVLLNIFSYFDPRSKCVFSLLPVPGRVDGAPEGGAGAEPAAVRAVRSLEVGARPLERPAGTRARRSAGPGERLG